MDTTIDKTWHLAINEAEREVTEFELQLWRVFYGFQRWQEECEKSANGTDLNASELAVLHIVRMKDKPKSVREIAKLLNRNDIYNIQYNIRKLLKMELIEKAGKNSQENGYQITKLGIQNTNSYSQLRRNILIDVFGQEQNLDLNLVSKQLAKVKSFYDEADRAVALSANPITDKKAEKPKKKPR